MMKKIIAFILSIFLLTGCSLSTSTEKTKKKETKEMTNYTVFVDDDRPLTIGDQIEDMNKYLTHFETLEIESSAVFYNNDDIEIFIGANGDVRKITLFTATYSLDNSIRIGSTRKNVKKIYQEYVDEKNDNYSHFCIQDINIDFTYKNDEIIKIELEKA